MTDRRLHPDPKRITEKTAAQITLPVVDLNRSPDGPATGKRSWVRR